MNISIKRLIGISLLIIVIIYYVLVLNYEGQLSTDLKYILLGTIVVIMFRSKDFIKYKIQWTKLFRLLFVKKSPWQFLDLVNKYIKKEKKLKIKLYLLVYKSIGLQYKGNFDGSLKTLEEVSVEKLEKDWRTNYYLNYFLTLIFYNKLEEAKKLFEEVQDSFRDIKTIKNVKPYIQKAYGIYEYYFGDKEKSKEILFESLNHKTHDYHQAICYYYIGSIARQSKNTQDSDIYFEKAKAYGKNSFVEELSGKQIE